MQNTLGDFEVWVEHLCKDLDLHKGNYGRGVSSYLRRTKPRSVFEVDKWVDYTTERLMEDIERPIWVDKAIRQIRKWKGLKDRTPLEVNDIVDSLLNGSLSVVDGVDDDG